ncbi:hypothetical protein DFH09DRAFT_1098332 [Mycena vulgaris]|nr:hypothetical protein DFH09DRAFT_1098332 [Mycena vulgaris]
MLASGLPSWSAESRMGAPPKRTALIRGTWIAWEGQCCCDWERHGLCDREGGGIVGAAKCPHKEAIVQSFGGRQGVINVADAQGNREERGINFEGAQAAERWNNMKFGDEKPTGGGGISVVGTGRISAQFVGPGLLPIRESVCNIRVSITDGDGVSGEEGDGVDETGNGYVICVIDEGKMGISGGEGWTTQPLSSHYSGLGGWLDAAAKAGSKGTPVTRRRTVTTLGFRQVRQLLLAVGKVLAPFVASRRQTGNESIYMCGKADWASYSSPDGMRAPLGILFLVPVTKAGSFLDFPTPKFPRESHCTYCIRTETDSIYLVQSIEDLLVRQSELSFEYHQGPDGAGLQASSTEGNGVAAS